MLKISAFYLDKQKSFVSKKKCGMLVIETLKRKISDFLNSNTCFCLRLYDSKKKIFPIRAWKLRDGRRTRRRKQTYKTAKASSRTK